MGTADARELGLQLQPRQWQAGNAAGGQQQVQAATGVFDQPQHQLVDRAAAGAVVVVQDHADAARCRAQRADQCIECVTRIVVAAVQGWRTQGRVRTGALQGKREVAEKARGLGVFFIQRQPCHGGRLARQQLRMPLRQQRALAEAGRCQQQGQRPRLRLIQHDQQAATHNRAGTRQRRLQLAGEQPIGKGEVARR